MEIQSSLVELNDKFANLLDLISNKPKKRLTRKETADALSVSVSMVDKLAQRGKLTRIKIGKKTLFDIEEVNSI